MFIAREPPARSPAHLIFEPTSHPENRSPPAGDTGYGLLAGFD
jgi:hypothetical protein